MARYEILLALRLILAPSPLPRMNSHAMEKLCKVIIERLWDPVDSESLFKQAAELVMEASDSDLDSAALRTEPFTDQLKALAVPAKSGVKKRPVRRSK